VLEGGDHARGSEGAALGRDVGEWIEADRPLKVGDIEVADLVDPTARDAVGNRLGEVAVRIDHRDALAGENVEHGEIEEKGRFARAGFTHNVEVASTFRIGEVDGFADCGGRYVERLWLHMPGQSPVRYRVRGARCLAVNASAYLWRSADAARRAALWALPARYAEIVPVCAANTPRPLSIPRALD
jgi:hypothetical protein